MASKIRRFLVPKHKALNPIQRDVDNDMLDARAELGIHTRATNGRRGPEVHNKPSALGGALAGKKIKPSVGGNSFEPYNNSAVQ